jgi:6-phosphogluconate dehydrogenase
MPNPVCDIGLVGLAVVGQKLVLSNNDHGYKVAVFNRRTFRLNEFVQDQAKGKPRRVMLIVKGVRHGPRT